MPSAVSQSPSPEVRVKRKRATPSEESGHGSDGAGSSGSDSGSSSSSSSSLSPPRRQRQRAQASSRSRSSGSPGLDQQRRRRRKRSRSATFGFDGDERAESGRAAAEQKVGNGVGHTNGEGEPGSAELAVATTRTEEKGDELRQQLAQLSTTRGGGAYIPPARLRALMAEAAAADPGSVEYQRMSWDALKKSITGLVNKVAAENIKFIVPELFGGANLIRGRGLFCRSIMKAQMQSLAFTPVFAALSAIVNTKLPMVGELLVTRLISQFRRSFKRNDKAVCNATAMFIAHLVNQRVVHEIVALEILVLLLEKPTDDSVEVAVSFMREVGAFLTEEAPKANNSIFDRFRAVLYEGDISKRVQFMIEVLSQVRRERFKDNPRVPEALDLVEEDDQITHQISLDDQLNVQETLNVFRADPSFVENEDRYREIKNEILGEGSDALSDASGSGSGNDSDSEDASDDEAEAQQRLDIQDQTETNMVNLRRTIYLTIMSSATFEEAVHKLMKLQIPEGQEIELSNMVIECCSQERTFTSFYGLIGERLCKLNRVWSECFEMCFRNYYDSIHRYETNRLRNIARFFGWLIASDGVSWACFSAVHMTEEDTTSSSRIFIKILMTEMKERIGIQGLVQRFTEPTMQECYANMMPKTDPKATRFSINFFTSIGIPQITDGMREHLKIVREEALAKAQLQDDESSSSDSDSDSSLSSSSLSSSSLSSSSYDSYRSRSRRRDSPPRASQASRRRPALDAFSPSRSPPPAARRARSPLYDSRSPPPRRRGRSPSYDSRSPPLRRRARSPSYDSRSPPPRRRARSPSYEPRSPPPRRGGRADSYTPSPSPSPPRRRAGRDSYDARSPSPRRRYDSRSPSPLLRRK